MDGFLTLLALRGSPVELERTREVLLDFLSKNPNTAEHRAGVESLTFLRKLNT